MLNAARQVGMRDVRWIAALVRASMQNQPQLGQRELEVLGRSHLALLAIGRNQNQLARAANASGGVGPCAGGNARAVEQPLRQRGAIAVGQPAAMGAK